MADKTATAGSRTTKAAGTKTTAKKTTKTTKTTRKKTLLVVESPSKAKIIGKYLGSSYKVIASVGHVRDLPKSRLGVEVDNDFEPEYINIRGKGDTIKAIKKEGKAASRILLATDPDREGEAIAWHLAYILDIDPSSDCRVTFNEINKEAVKEALKHPRPIDMGLVDAQQARRVLDRLVGYQISPLLWKKVRRGLSAGRVQSAALKILCDRETEIQNFVPEEYWNIYTDFTEGFKAQLSKIDGKKAAVAAKEDAEAIASELHSGAYEISEIKPGHRSPKAYAPFTTSSMQQDASIKLGFQTRKTMQVAQQLYEGIEIKGRGARGLVTYIRTDSVRISSAARAAAKEFIEENYGSRYTSDNFYSNKKKDIQDAHEAIRPADVTLTPEEAKESLSPDQYKLYNLIWTRFVASQMAPAEVDTMAVKVKNGRFELKANGSRQVFDGWRKVYKTSAQGEEADLPILEQGQELGEKEIIKEQKFTQPPARYTEAGLVKEMEEQNIGRPSTYAAIITTLTARKYVKREKKSLVPTKLGFDVIGILQDYFTDIVDVKFTGEMEDKLDDVEMNKEAWKHVIEDFYGGFSKELEVADKEVERIQQEVVLSDEKCELCGRPMAIKEGRFGKFLACTGYPECKNTKPIVKKTGVKCPVCGKDIVEKKSRKRGRIFYGCMGYPDCTVVYWDKPTGRMCPECGAMLVETNGKTKQIKCSNPECKYKEKAGKDNEEAAAE